MTLDSQLGSPNLFDLIGFCGELDWGVNTADFNDFYTKNVFRFVFGANTVFTRVVLKKIPQAIGPYGFDASLPIISAGLPSGREFYNFTTPDRKARRIDSVEQFRNEIQPAHALAITASGRKWTTYLLGIYYSSL